MTPPSQLTSTGSGSNSLRKRKQPRRSARGDHTIHKPPPTPETTPETPEESDDDSPPTLINVLKGHFLTYAVLLLGVPYGVWLGYRWVVLQHPLHMMRSAVRLQDKRQVLIVGSMSSGTSHTAHLLSRYLEVGHEDADTAWKFVRDGTVSWFHGIRYWNASHNKTKRIDNICRAQYLFYASNTLSDNYGFGPTLFGTPDYPCPWWEQSPKIPSQCYQAACRKALEREYACGGNDEAGCTTPFQTTLLQAREPYKIVASLTAKYCLAADGVSIKSSMPTTLQIFWVALGVTTTTTQQQQQQPLPHCVEQMARYVLLYYNTVLDAGVPHFRIEDLPRGSDEEEQQATCQLMKLAGLDTTSTTVYPPNHDLYERVCGDGHRTTSSPPKNDDAVKKTTPGDKLLPRHNAINKGRVTTAQLMEFLGRPTQQEMKDLYHRLGYDATNLP